MNHIEDFIETVIVRDDQLTEDDLDALAREWGYVVDLAFGYGGELNDDETEVCADGPDARAFISKLRAHIKIFD